MYGNQFVNQKQPDFNVKIYKGSNSVQLATNESGLLNSIQNSKMDRALALANMKQFLSYHMMRLVSESFNYLDYNIYTIVNSYVNSLNIMAFLDKEGGNDALKFNIIAEIYKISQLMLYYQKPLVSDIETIKEEVGALVDKLFKSM